MIRILFFWHVVAGLLVAQVHEPAINHGAPAAWQALLRLQTTATVLHITAHPDDEDGALLTWLTRSQGVRTGLLTLNRGEGGANLAGPELYDALGILRTEELLAAGRFYGVDQFFTRTVDFGFSKRLDETLEHWGRENVLRDVVRVIRLYRPDIIVSRFHGEARDGHGNHQAAGLRSVEAYRAAGDHTMFRDQFTDGLGPWQVRKLYFEVRENEPYTLRIDTGRYDPLLGASYREIAREGLSMQRSQGAGQVRAPRGPSYSYLRLIESTDRKPRSESSIFDGLDTSAHGLERFTGIEIGKYAAAAVAALEARQPWRALPHLAAGLTAARAAFAAERDPGKDVSIVGGPYQSANKVRVFIDAANKALGISLDVRVDPDKPADGPFAMFQPRETFAVAIPGQRFTITATAFNRGEIPIDPGGLTLQTPAGWRVTQLKADLHTLGFNQSVSAQFAVDLPADAALTRPYWSRDPEVRDHLYTISQPKSANLPYAPPEVTGVFTYRLNGVEFSLTQPAQTQYLDRLGGEQPRLLTVAPAISVSLLPASGVVQASSAPAKYAVRVSAMSNVKSAAQA